jgi:hypothetical protein
VDIERRTFIAGLGGVAVAAPLLAACSRGDDTGKTVGAAPAGAAPTAKPMIPEPAKGEPASLVSQERIDTSITGARAWRVRYISRDVNGVAHEASGLVIAPDAAGQDRPIFTWCHGTTGLGDAACPSAQPDPARELITYFEPRATGQIDFGVPGMQGFIDDGWVVCATDYQGATYTMSDVTLSSGELVTWDRGYDAAGTQVWGSTKGPYTFRRFAAAK